MRAADTDVSDVRSSGRTIPTPSLGSSTDTADNASRKLILIAEDEAPIADAISMIVEDAGYTPLVADHGEHALALARLHHPALIITDLMMPRLDGIGLIEALQEDARHNGYKIPPIILMTAAGMKRALEVGADAVVRKPFNVDDLEALIRRLAG